MRRKPETRLRSLQAIRLERHAGYARICKHYGWKFPDVLELTLAERDGVIHEMNEYYKEANKASAPTTKKR